MGSNGIVMEKAKEDHRDESWVHSEDTRDISPLSDSDCGLRTADCRLHLKECGVVLVALLWVFIALSAIVLSFARESRVEVTATRNNQSLEKAYYIARAGISETIYKLVHQRLAPQVDERPVGALEVGRALPARDVAVARAVGADPVEEVLVCFRRPAPDGIAGLRVETGKVLAEPADDQPSARQADPAAVDRRLLRVVPEDLLRGDVDGEERLRESPRVRRLVVLLRDAVRVREGANLCYINSDY